MRRNLRENKILCRIYDMLTGCLRVQTDSLSCADGDLQGADVLGGGAEFVHDEDVLRLEDFAGGKTGGDFYRHGIGFSCIFVGIPNFTFGFIRKKNALRAFFKFYAPTRGGAKEDRSRSSLDSPRPEEVSSGHLCVLEVEQ